MNAEDREMLIETHTMVRQNHKALHGNGRAGLIEEVNEAKGAIGAFKYMIGVGFSLCGLLIAGLGVWVALKG